MASDRRPNFREPDEDDEPLSADVSAELAKALAIDKHNLDEDLLGQPQLFFNACEVLDTAVAERDAIKDRVKVAEAEVDAQIRHDAEVAGDKLTEKAIDGQKVLNTKLRQLHGSLQHHNDRVRRLEHLREAFTERRHALRGLVELYNASYYADPSAAASRGAKTRVADEARRQLHERRQQEQPRTRLKR